MIRRLLTLGFVLTMLTACAGRTGDGAPVVAQGPFTEGDVLRVLQEAGLQASSGSEIPQDISAFGVKGYAIRVGPETFQVYVYPTEKEQQQVVISADGSEISSGDRAAMVDWVAPPNFVRRANLLITIATTDKQFVEQVRQAVQDLK